MGVYFSDVLNSSLLRHFPTYFCYVFFKFYLIIHSDPKKFHLLTIGNNCVFTAKFKTDSGKKFFRKGHCVSEDEFSSLGTRNEPMSAFRMISPQIMTLQLPCWHFIFLGQKLPLKTHPLAQQSGPSIVAFDSSVKRANLKTVFLHFLDHSVSEHLCLGVKESFCSHSWSSLDSQGSNCR